MYEVVTQHKTWDLSQNGVAQIETSFSTSNSPLVFPSCTPHASAPDQKSQVNNSTGDVGKIWLVLRSSLPSFFFFFFEETKRIRGKEI